MSVTGQNERTPLEVGDRSAGTGNTPGAPNAALKENPPKPGEGVDPNHKLAAKMQVFDAAQGIVIPNLGEAKRRGVAICGFASATRRYILDWCANKPDFEIWGLNQLYRHIPRADRWFDIHWNWDQEVVPGTDHRRWAAECGIPFYMIQQQPDVPTSVRFPIERIMKHFGAIDYFTSTIPYMLALAIEEIDLEVNFRMKDVVESYVQHRLSVAAGNGEQTPPPDFIQIQRDLYAEYSIAVFGIDLVVGGEYFHEKPCAEFWLGAAALGRGIKVMIPPESALCKQLHRYGYDSESAQLLRTEEIAAHTDELRKQRDEQWKRCMMLEGAMEANERWRQTIELRSRGAKV